MNHFADQVIGAIGRAAGWRVMHAVPLWVCIAIVVAVLAVAVFPHIRRP